ncbi:MAG: FHA domain-containing protein [Sciscionella sp.]
MSQGPGAGTNFALPPGTTRAGRYRACELMLDDPSVSRTHAEFRRTDQHVVLSDLGSLNGTYHNRSPCQEVILVDGDEIWIGTFHAIFRDRPPPSASG